MKPKLLDLFCGAGGCSAGYAAAGFEIVGVDINPQRNYPFEFIQMDALEAIKKYGPSFDIIHASPPCQRYSILTPIEYKNNHPDLLVPTRKAIKTLEDKIYIIENVPGARHLMINPIMICGTMFGMNLWRHRYFECNPVLTFPPATCNHSKNPVMISGTSRRHVEGKRVGENTAEECRKESGLTWMTRKEMDEAIPPAYTEWIGNQLLKKILHK